MVVENYKLILFKIIFIFYNLRSLLIYFIIILVLLMIGLL